MTAGSTPPGQQEPQDAARQSNRSGDVEKCIADARAGHPEALGHLAERCRQYLLLVANRELHGPIKSKVGASDLVQDTWLTAQQAFGRFEGGDEDELRLWLRRILLNKLAHVSRFYTQTAKRDIRREQPFIEGNSTPGYHANNCPDLALTPRGNAIAKEQAQALEQAIARLPERFGQLIRWRSLERQSFVVIGELLGISADAARKAWCQAVKRLRQELGSGNESR